MNKSLLNCTILALALALAGCNSDGTINKQDVGLVGGGVAGGALGHALGGNTVSTVGGAVGGAYLGSKVGQSMDNSGN